MLQKQSKIVSKKSTNMIETHKSNTFKETTEGEQPMLLYNAAKPISCCLICLNLTIYISAYNEVFEADSKKLNK